MKSEPNPDWKPPTKEIRGEGAGKGDQLRRGVNWKQYGENYDAIFRKRRRMTASDRLMVNEIQANAKAWVKLARTMRRMKQWPTNMGETVRAVSK